MQRYRCAFIGMFLGFMGSVPFAETVIGETIHVDAGGEEAGLAVKHKDVSGIGLRFQIVSSNLNPITIDGTDHRRSSLPDVLLPNDAGAPDLLGIRRFMAPPHGATPRIEMVSVRTRTFRDVDISPAPIISFRVNQTRILTKLSSIESMTGAGVCCPGSAS